jgi:hypothetical protein
MPGRIENTVFISYRRTNLPWALAVYQNLTSHGLDVFFDYQSINSGDFEQIIVGNIKARAHFLILLTPSALERCKDPGDWLRREIETALDVKRNIVPLFLEGFDFGNQKVAPSLTGKIELLKNYNGLNIPADYFDEAMERLRNRFLNVSLDTVLHPLTSAAQQAAIEQQTAVNRVEDVQPPQPFKQVVLNQDLSYMFLYGKNGVSWSGIPENLLQKIQEAYGQGQEFKSVALGPNSSWVLLYGFNTYWWYGISDLLAQKLQETYSQGQELKSIALAPNGSWVLLYGFNASWWFGIPDMLALKIQEVSSQGFQVKSVALGPNFSWVFFCGYNGFYWYGVPGDLVQRMQEAYMQGYEFKSITLGPNSNWVFLYGYNGYWSSNAPQNLLDQMAQAYKGTFTR